MPGGTPYLTPAMLLSRPAGLSWTVVPRLTASTDEQIAQLWQVCWNATSAADTYCQQPLRATVNTETLTGPGQPRVSVSRDTGIGTLVTRRSPVTSVAAIQTSPARSFPPAWSPVPADQVIIRNPVILSAAPALDTVPSGGNVIDVAPPYISWDQGRGGLRVLASYLSAWPHASLTADAAQGDGSLAVDDVTGWAGSCGLAYDSPTTEVVAVAGATATVPAQLPGNGGTVQSGPGTLTLAAPLTAAHLAGTVISAIPPVALRAVALTAATEALEAINAIAVQSLSGQSAGGTGALATESEYLLSSFMRVI